MSDSPSDTHEPRDISQNGRQEVGTGWPTGQEQSPHYTLHALHDDQDEWVAAYAADELSADERAVFARHLADCASCQDALAQTRRIRTLLGSLAFAAPALDDAAQLADADDALAMPAEQAPFVYADQPGPSASSEWTSRPLSSPDRVSLADARVGDAEQGAPPDERLRAALPGRLATGANALRSRRGATGDMDPNTQSGDPHAQAFANRFDDPVDKDASRSLTAQMGNGPRRPPTPTPRRRRPYVALAATLLLVALAVGVFGVLRSRNGGPGTGAAPTPTVSHVGQATPPPTGVPIDPQTGLPLGANISAIQMLSATDGWAVGAITTTTNTSTGGVQNAASGTPTPSPTSTNVSTGIILHYGGGRWTVVGAPIPGMNLTSIFMLSDTEGWALSGAYSNQAQNATSVILRDHNGHWSKAATFTNDYLSQVQMLSATDGWIIGLNTATKAGSVILHYVNGTWVNIPNSLMAVAGVSMVSAADGWIVGNDGTIGRYQNGAWSRWSQTAIGPLNAVQMLSATDGWAVGLKSITISSGDINTDPYIIHYNGSSWQEVAEPSVTGGGQINAISMDSATDGWAVGQLQGQTGPVAPGLLFHYVNGQWVNVPLSIGVDLVAVSMVSVTDGWAIGDAYGANGSPIIHYVNGVWTPYRA